MIENLRRTSTGPERGCRRTALSDAVEIDGVREKSVRRKRLELQRLKSLDQIQSGFGNGDWEWIAGDGCNLKEKKIKNLKVDTNLAAGEEEECLKRKAAVVSLTLTLSSSNQLPEDGFILSRTSSFIDDQNKAKGVTCWSYGSMMSVIGRRREMEDAVALEQGFMRRGSKEYDFFGVYDGHGGSRVAHVCRDRLHRLLAEKVQEEDHKNSEGGLDWNKVMVESFKKMDEEVNKNGAAVASMGSTAVVAVVGEEEMVVANCGDSRAVLSRGGVAMALSNDHKPDRPDELERIELSGGMVINWNGQRVLGVLATSRSIGDHYLKPYVIPDPEIIVSKKSSRDEFLILASDGLWDVVSNEVACHVVRRCLDGQISSTAVQEMVNNGKRFSTDQINAGEADDLASPAAVLAELAIARGSGDNISVIVVVLQHSGKLLHH